MNVRRSPATTGQPVGEPQVTRNFHLRALLRAWRPFGDKSLSHWTTTIVIALALTIHGAFALILVNANSALSHWEEANLVTVFMQRNVERESLIQVGKTIQNQPDVSGVTIITPKEAAQRLKQMLGAEAALLDELDENPLPYSLEFHVTRPERTRIPALAQEIRSLNGVDAVSYDQEWAQRLSRVVDVLRFLGNSVSFLLLLAVALIVSNTIKLTIIARRDEVEIMRFLGADDGFIRAPFVYEGVLQGVLGAALALVLVGLLHGGAQDQLRHLGQDFGITLHWMFLPWTQLLLLVGLGAFLGLAGALFAVSRFLQE
ncbi:MAG: ABC transporter permease [Magnetococcales bacterium]|nr:ABC transporter permease [Magnetococcales bacterium]